MINPNRPHISSNGILLQYKIRGNTIIHCYDGPHLIKVVRNNFEKKDLTHHVDKRCEISGSKNVQCLKKSKPQRASWSHVKTLYELDCLSSYRLLPKLTDEHLKPEKNKMKVSDATQIFSKTVGEVMLLYTAGNQVPRNFSETANILLFFNDLFDSINGGGEPQRDSLKGSIDENSIHFAYWEYALSELSNMNFVNVLDGKVNNASTVLRKFKSTIRGYIEITRICLNANMQEVALRYNFSFFPSCFFVKLNRVVQTS